MPTTKISPRLLPTLFASLARTPTWTLRRTLQSDNPLDLHGDLHGEASFQPLPAPPSTSTPTEDPQTQTLYTESGSLPATLGPNLRWTKSYIWRLSPEGRISVWFVKVTKDAATHPEADYLFHEVEFEVAVDGADAANTGSGSGSGSSNDETYVTPPAPPELLSTSKSEAEATVVVTARGNHLCIKDMYRTAYAFRVRAESGEVVSWASRHVVKGPRKDQDIVNLYSVG
ncbi:hypothetical protein ASPACDRAFT_58923 [Aspergillus aculeatus ATCC 16872]|uniref:DUF6314 domain-containing protein n=1 Tax=Aspergillus aculeatus (strain ATCC 16872 / CBS 172.66 / WB 5094) TaxID=690307 RepID=A0A1L9WYH1_ASPA1|nr:uncharacterized protein ASPACDRAFT_58923 [Aspergillus aculeatus ATCC 16872]OJK01193.1 hypothetical protein ASPACDRAFT_58923 [Aspergillus aculeatus ATCC 16872]